MVTFDRREALMKSVEISPHKLTPYTNYKETDFAWIRTIPRHWFFIRLDRLFYLRNEPPSKHDQRVTAYLDGRVTLRSNVIGQKIKGVIKESGWQRIFPGDLAISGMNAHIGGIGVSDSKGKCSPIYLVLIPKHNTNVYYISRVLRYAAHCGALKILVNTIRFNSADFKRDDLKSIKIWCPPLEEQQAIVRYLDYADRRIQRYIRAKQKLIKLLEEQKQAIIHQAVTRGLDPTVRMKPSGVEWLGEIPEHWEVRPLKRWVKINSETLGETTDQDFEFDYIDISSVKTGTLKHPPTKMKFRNAPSRARRILHYGDTIISTVRTYLKAIWYVNQYSKNYVASTGFAVLRPDNNMEPELISYVLQSPYFINKVSAYSTGTAYPAISENILGGFLIAFPPTKEEQIMLVNSIKSKTTNLEKTIISTLKEISLIKEYRTRLIADVVTGKLDVRAAAARLPDESEALTLDEEDDALAEDADLIEDLEAAGEEGEG